MANTHKGRTIYVSNAAVGDEDLDLAAFEALTWVEIGDAGMIGDIGSSSNIINYDTLNTDVSQKQKGVTNAGDPQLEVARDYDDPGQILMRTYADTKFNYGFKVVNDDAPSASFNGSIIYLRGMVASAVNVGGRVDDFDLETYNIALNQRPLRQDPAATVIPANTIRPTISGTGITQGSTLTAHEGTWTNSPTSYSYQWQADTAGNGTFADIVGATAKTYVLAVGQAGDAVRVNVTATNAAGPSAAAASSLPVGLVV
jgi:hypothetical protein